MRLSISPRPSTTLYYAFTSLDTVLVTNYALQIVAIGLPEILSGCPKSDSVHLAVRPQDGRHHSNTGRW
ncbi:hypothetical protein A0H81_12484 [Grifola frondosa]|uniref:Uncharacterized protein n=1 Tax=Grifola frondosa TaxID=5627 RepID=A0A1C7LS55_GRIFR|nr:hypothetical protein A0H81_12484 [Grifola frondosa]